MEDMIPEEVFSRIIDRHHGTPRMTLELELCCLKAKRGRWQLLLDNVCKTMCDPDACKAMMENEPIPNQNLEYHISCLERYRETYQLVINDVEQRINDVEQRIKDCSTLRNEVDDGSALTHIEHLRRQSGLLIIKSCVSTTT